MKEHWVGNASMRHKGVRGFWSALLRHKLTRNGARGFGIGTGCSGMVLTTRDGRRQVRIGQIGVGLVTVVTKSQRPVFQGHRYLVIYIYYIQSTTKFTTLGCV